MLSYDIKVDQKTVRSWKQEYFVEVQEQKHIRSEKSSSLSSWKLFLLYLHANLVQCVLALLDFGLSCILTDPRATAASLYHR